MAEQQKSLVWMIAMLMLVIALFGWAFAAAAYAHNVEHWREGGVGSADEIGGAPSGGRVRVRMRSTMYRVGAASLMDFVGNAFSQVPNFPQVVAFTFRHRLWLALLIVGLETVVLFGGWKLRGLDRALSEDVPLAPGDVPRRKRRNGRKPSRTASRPRSRP